MPQLEVHFLAGAMFAFLIFLVVFLLDVKKLKKGFSLYLPLLMLLFGFFAAIPDAPTALGYYSVDSVSKEATHQPADDVFFFHVWLDSYYGVGREGQVIESFIGILILYSLVFALYINVFYNRPFEK